MRPVEHWWKDDCLSTEKVKKEPRSTDGRMRRAQGLADRNVFSVLPEGTFFPYHPGECGGANSFYSEVQFSRGLSSHGGRNRFHRFFELLKVAGVILLFF